MSLSTDQRTQLIAACNSGRVTRADLSSQWGLSRGKIGRILRDAQREGVRVLPVDMSAMHRLVAAKKRGPQGDHGVEIAVADQTQVARSYDDLSATWRIIAEQRIVAGKTKDEARWFYSLSDADRIGVEFDRGHGLVTTSLARIDGVLCLLAKLAPVERRGRR